MAGSFLKDPNRRLMSQKSNASRHWGHSLRKLSWDESKDKTLSQKLISSAVHEWYDAKHRMTSTEEIKLINSLKTERCPFCCSASIKRNGFYRSLLIRYYCNECYSGFSALTVTIFSDKKIPISEWIEYLIHLFEFHSITTSCQRQPKCLFYWQILAYQGILSLKALSG